MGIHDINESTNPMNSGSEYGNKLIKHSIKTLGLGRGIVVDKDNNVICGNKVLKNAKQLGYNKIRVIETQGDELVVVKRVDIGANTKIGLEMALVDNLACLENIEWDAKTILSNMHTTWGFDPRNWGGDGCIVQEIKIEDLLSQQVIQNPPKTKDRTFSEVYQQSLFD